MQPIIKTNAWYTLVTAKNEVINASWCKQQLARILKKSTDTIILFDVTGSYAVLQGYGVRRGRQQQLSEISGPSTAGDEPGRETVLSA